MKSYREQFEEVWPVPDGISYANGASGYAPYEFSDRLVYLALEHNVRLDTFSRCQEATNVYASLIDEMIDEVEGLSIAAYGCVIGKTQDIIDRAQSLLDYKK